MVKSDESIPETAEKMVIINKEEPEASKRKYAWSCPSSLRMECESDCDDDICRIGTAGSIQPDF